MRICFLAPANSAHIVKWSSFFVSRGHEVHTISFTKGEIPGTTVHYIDCGAEGDSSDVKKLGYLLKAGEVRKLVREIRPDIVNAHYATSYGAVAALAGIENYILSVWGSDIYEFPRKSLLHRAFLKFSLQRAPHLFSTSRAMADEAGNYTKKAFDITPFGVDTALFSPEKRERRDGDFVIGTVKGLSHAYGIDYLLKAAAILRREHPDVPLKVRIAGKGPDEETLKGLADELGISDIVSWLGFISQKEAAKEWANMDVAVVYSTANESFGVSAVEAQACACPVVISDAPGLMEASLPGTTSLVLPREKAELLAEALWELYQHPEKRRAMGQRGRAFVLETYEYRRCFEKIEALYSRMRS